MDCWFGPEVRVMQSYQNGEWVVIDKVKKSPTFILIFKIQKYNLCFILCINVYYDTCQESDVIKNPHRHLYIL